MSVFSFIKMVERVEFVKESDCFRFVCPHCQGTVQVGRREINCKIFRHGAFKTTNEPINPHASKEECDRLTNFNLIHGCGKPFQLFIDSGQMFVKQCEYI